MEPHAVLGVNPGASAEEVGRAYRRLARRHHPDVAGPGSAPRMAEINSAYELMREQLTAQLPASRQGAAAQAQARRAPGWWLDGATRLWLAPELLDALRPNEPVRAAAVGATPDSPVAQIIVTDRRLLWLRDEVVLGRVKSVSLSSVTAVAERLPGRLRSGQLVVEAAGRTHRFRGLGPAAIASLAAALRAPGPRA